jgi:hypothetical protein
VIDSEKIRLGYIVINLRSHRIRNRYLIFTGCRISFRQLVIYMRNPCCFDNLVMAQGSCYAGYLVA